MIEVWAIERDPEYLAWLATIEERHPRVPMDKVGSKLRPGSSYVGRTLLLATAGEGGELRLGVQLNTGDIFWKRCDATFEALLAQEAAAAGIGSDGSHARTREALDEFVAAAGGSAAVRLEFCSSHVGGFTRAVAPDDADFYLSTD